MLQNDLIEDRVCVMQTKPKPISPLLYYILLSNLINLACIGIGLITLALFSASVYSQAITILVIFLLWKGVVIGLVIWFLRKRSLDKNLMVKFIGAYYGRFYGLIIGGFVGARIANILGLAAFIGFSTGALVLYFAGRWIGSKAIISVDARLGNVFQMSES